MLTTPLKFTTPTLLHLIRRRGGEPHQTLAGTPTWYDEEAQRTVDQQVNAVLTEQGLMGPRGMDRDLLAALESISRPQVEYYGWFEGRFADAPPNFTVLAAGGSGGAFVLARFIEDDGVLITSERPENLLRGFVNQIPPGRPGGGQALVVSKGEFLSGRPSGADDTGAGVLRPAPGQDQASSINEIKRILQAERISAGSLYVAVRGQSGVRRRCERPLNFIDTAEGRWLMEEVPGRGEPLVVFTPATPQLLAERLRNAQSTLN
ncbi:ESX secretion-associated protein EspG [Amycolatopsis cihanbeyliensis]|uniref:ESAT-6 protein secretion system EspG family protein n=1 Tax=Amycolatopsis cihanbeyliensis TaxID=1128664 RepID=A0A542DL33_AMYCI|nr:ESX secretion-associated protein EspG [Amycolatopsis cihanbeyliensis]TQJ03812.1 ESAT-6 protein secretion system EspG family protein [Amycolatopsis cihanbeyliensis]